MKDTACGQRPTSLFQNIFPDESLISFLSSPSGRYCLIPIVFSDSWIKSSSQSWMYGVWAPRRTWLHHNVLLREEKLLAGGLHRVKLICCQDVSIQNSAWLPNIWFVASLHPTPDSASAWNVHSRLPCECERANSHQNDSNTEVLI